MIGGTVVIGGGTGFIGTALTSLLRYSGYNVTVVSRLPGRSSITWSDLATQGLPKDTTAVISLAGQNILDRKRKWNDGFKQTVKASRINTTRALAQAIEKAPIKPKVFISTSGVGYYPPSPDKEYTEDSIAGKGDYFAELCTEWEAAAKLPDGIDVRQVIIRSGVVLGRRGGMIAELYWPFFFGLGGPVGSGKQYLPWIHIHDISRLFLFAMEEEKIKSGVLNGVAPNLITSRQFASAFGYSLLRPAIIPMPELMANVLFGPERATMLLQGQKVIPKRVLELGFTYKFPDIKSACKEFSPLVYTNDFVPGDNER